MKSIKSNPQGGFSLIEVFAVLVMIGVLTALALLAFGSSKIDLQRQAIVREFKIDLERARFDSVKRRAEGPNQATITLDSSKSFRAALDFNEDGILEASETRTVDFTQKSQTQILVTDTLNYPITITFDRRGHATTVDGLGNNVVPTFTICSNCTSASPDRSVISLSTTGTVAVTRNEADPSTIPTPAVSNTIATPNCYIYVPGVNANVNTVCPLQ